MSFEEWLQNNATMYRGDNASACMQAAYTAGLLRAAEIAEGMEGSWADLEWNQVCRDIAAAIRKEAGDGSST